MRVYLTLLRRELASYFVSITGYVVIAVAAFLVGLSFVDLLEAVGQETLPVHVTEVFYQTPYFWVLMLLSAPVVTMRLFAQEKFAGTYETLMTAPVRDTEVVLAKFSAAFLFFAVMWLPLLAAVLVVRQLAGDIAALDWRVLGVTCLGIGLLGGLFLAMGCFASALTRAQTVAAILALLFGVSLFLLGFVAGRLAQGNTWSAAVFGQLTLFEHMQDFTRGILDVRPVVCYGSLTVLFLYLTVRVVESRRWM